MRYYRWRWNETRGDEYSGWGASTWLWAEDDERWSVDQWEIYDGGQVLHYDQVHSHDEYGSLGDQQSDPDTWPPGVEELTLAKYRQAIAGRHPLNR